jgi:DNA invertase Pin-like site-specific DNA recombinase
LFRATSEIPRLRFPTDPVTTAREKGRAVVGYLRCSTEEQTREGLGLTAQENRIRAYSIAHGLVLADLFTDAGVSGKTLDRPRLGALLSRVRAGEVGTLIVARLDRLTRRTRDLLALIEDVLRPAGVELVSLAERLDTGSPAGMMVITMLGAMGQLEREIIGERTRAALAVKRERGERLGGEPLGFRATGPKGALEPLESELAPVHLILAKRGAGASFRTIAEDLRAAGVPSKRGGTWRSETVRKVWLRRAFYERLLPTS